MLLGNSITKCTNHKNLTHPSLTHTSDRVLRQCLLLEEYGAGIECIPGVKNVMANALSRLPSAELFTFEQNADFPLELQVIA